MTSTSLAEILGAEIAAGGPIPFRAFMERALYDPAHGYYTSGRARIGRKGDFFTNVSVGPLFGKLMARKFVRLWRDLEQPRNFSIVEQGAHDGLLAADILGELAAFAPDCHAATTYHIVEPSAALAASQRERLTGHPVKWHKTLDALPSFTGVHFSNELIDAFPVHSVCWTGTEWQERHVTLADGRFVFCDRPLSSPELKEACPRIPSPLPPGYVTEINLAAPAWLRSVAAKLERGSVLLVDYGYPREMYFDPARIGGTLSAYVHHRRVEDPLEHPGEVDLTAHVEFTSVMEAGEAAGLTVAEFTDQHRFIVPLGVEYFADGAHANERRAFQTLMHPQFMGSAFKVLHLQRA